MTDQEGADGFSEWSEVESVAYQSLVSDKVFESAEEVFTEAKEKGFDFYEIQERLHLDEYGMAKLINYIRKCTKEGLPYHVDNVMQFSDEVYLLPVLENDAVLMHVMTMDE